MVFGMLSRNQIILACCAVLFAVRRGDSIVRAHLELLELAEALGLSRAGSTQSWSGSGDVEVAADAGVVLEAVDLEASGEARTVSGTFRVGLTALELLKTKFLLWRAGIQRPYAVDSAPDRSVLVLDSIGGSAWHRYARDVHRKKLQHCETWTETRSSDYFPVTAYTCGDADVNTRKGQKASKVLDLFRKDRLTNAALLEVFGVDASRCQHLREGVLISVQHSEMTPDTFHPDLCTGDQVPGSHKGLTVVIYPHDRWEPTWGGHIELQAAEGAAPAAAMVAPLPNRSVILDGCIRHRATNSAAAAAPVTEKTAVPESLLRFDDRKYTGSLGESPGSWNQWRFAFVMQLGCPFVELE